MGVNSLPKTVTRQRRGCDLNQGPTAPESSTLTTRLPSHPDVQVDYKKYYILYFRHTGHCIVRRGVESCAVPIAGVRRVWYHFTESLSHPFTHSFTHSFRL